MSKYDELDAALLSPPCLAAFHPLPLPLHAPNCCLSCCAQVPPVPTARPRCPVVQMAAGRLGEALPSPSLQQPAVSPRFLLSTWLLRRPGSCQEQRGEGSGRRIGWMGSNCQQSQHCTDTPDKFLGVPASSGPHVLPAIPPTPSPRPWRARAASITLWHQPLQGARKSNRWTALSRRNMDVTARSWLACQAQTRV